MFDDFWRSTEVTVSGEIEGQSYSIRYGEPNVKWWLLIIAALIVGMVLAGRVRIVR